MLIPLEFIKRKRGLLDPTNYEDSIEHAEFTERLCKTLYYGKTPTTDRPSLPVTELAVGFLADAAPRELGRVDLSLASDMSRQACISPCSMMLGMIYVDRLKHRNPEYLQQVSSSDLFLISMMMASKYLYDEGVDEEVFNDEWAESADMDVEEVNSLERAFLKAIDWQLYVRQAEFFDLLERIERRVARDKGRERGFLTYTDLVVLSGDGRLNQALHAIFHELCKVVVACSVAYVAGLLTMVGSTVSLVCLQQSALVHPLVPSQPFTAPASLGLPSLPHSKLDLEVSNTETSWFADGNGSTDNGDGHWTGAQDSTYEHVERKPANAIGMSGLLTLAFIKDTVVGFVMAMKTGERNKLSYGLTTQAETGAKEVAEADQDADGYYQEEDRGVVCTCGCCAGPVDRLQHCVNVSRDDGHVDGLTQKTDTQRLWGHGAWRRPDGGGCELAAGAQCCCRPLTKWQPGLSRNLGKSELEKPFHNVVLGFGTTAEAIVT